MKEECAKATAEAVDRLGEEPERSGDHPPPILALHPDPEKAGSTEGTSLLVNSADSSGNIRHLLPVGPM